MRIRTLFAAVSGLSLAIVVACGSEGDSLFTDGADAGEEGGSSSGDNAFGSADGGDTGATDGGLTGDGASCAASNAQALLAKRPVDIIFVIDNSGSMSGEIAEVENQINKNFAAIIGASGLDYRVIMVSRYGAYLAGQSICVSSPLSDASCATIFPGGGAGAGGTRPAETTRFFHYNREIGSTNGWCALLDSVARADSTDGYTLHDAGIGPLLRPTAFKTVVVITDDRVSCTVNALRPDGGGSQGSRTFNDGNTIVAGESAASAFDLALRDLLPSQFGDPDAGDGGTRNYVFHAINALADYQLPDAGVDGGPDPRMHPPAAPVTTAECTPGAQNPGTGYQALARLTNGYRYPSCGLEYTAIFKEMAKGVVQSSAISCDFAVPQPAPGETLDLATLAVQYTPGAGGGVDAGVQEFVRAADLAACGPGKFWLEGGASGTVHLCPQTCDAVKSDLGAKISVVSGCARLNPPTGPGGPK